MDNNQNNYQYNYTYGDGSQSTYPQNPPQYNPYIPQQPQYTQPEPKKSHIGLIIGIVAGVLGFIAVCVIAVVLISRKVYDLEHSTGAVGSTTEAYTDFPPDTEPEQMMLGSTGLGQIWAYPSWTEIPVGEDEESKFEEIKEYKSVSDPTGSTQVLFVDSGEYSYVSLVEYSRIMVMTFAGNSEISYAGTLMGFDNAVYGGGIKTVNGGTLINIDVYCFKGNDGHYRSLILTYQPQDEVTAGLWQQYTLDCGITPFTKEEYKELTGE